MRFYELNIIIIVIIIIGTVQIVLNFEWQFFFPCKL